MKYSYKTNNTCSKQIEFEIDGDILKNVKYLGGGCPGNLQALPRLVDGMKVNDVIEKLSDIKCGMRGTSCAAELAKALKEVCKK